MADNSYLKPSYDRLLIDHARISQTFYRPHNTDMQGRMNTAAGHHQAMIDAIEIGDSSGMVELILEHWQLSKDRFDQFVRPDPLPIDLSNNRKQSNEGFSPNKKRCLKMKFEGIYTPIITPYRNDFSIDYERLSEVTEFLIKAGVHGIICAGTTGEYYAQTRQERYELMHFLQKQIDGRVSYIVGTGAIRTEDSIEFAEEAVRAKADALLVATPPYAVPTEREVALHALAIDRAANLPIMLYNYPGRMGVNMEKSFSIE